MKTFDQLVNISEPNVVLYHAECTDGFGAAWAVWKRFPTAKFIPVKHGDPPPDDLSDQHVVMVDFSYGRDVITAMHEQTASLYILDHHVTAQAALADLPFVHFDMEKSGAVLAWEWLHEGAVPWLSHYIQDKDLWQWRLPNSREINAALSSYPFEFSVWDTLRQDVLEVEGRGILRHENVLIDKMVAEAVMVEFEGKTVPAVYSPVLTSQIGERLAKDNPFGVIWHQRNGRRYFSLRSRSGGVSVANIAARYGGGGHTHAAGFSLVLNAEISGTLDPIRQLIMQEYSDDQVT
ncbi:MAG: phosphoesterase [Nitrospirales bacterium]